MGQSNGKTWPPALQTILHSDLHSGPQSDLHNVNVAISQILPRPVQLLPHASHLRRCKKRSVQFHHRKEKSLSSKYQPNDQVKSQSSFVFLPSPPLLLPIEACRSKKIPLLCKSGSLDTAPSSVQTEQTQYLTKPQRLSVKRRENYGHFMNRDSRELLEINGLWP